MKIGVSACLLGVECNWSAGHNRYPFVSEDLAKYVEYVPLCPEAPVLGVPRETIRLVKEEGRIKVKGHKSERDYTQPLMQISQEYLKRLKEEGVCGFILKAKSPTCGMERVKVYNPQGIPERESEAGIFAKILRQAMPHLPIEEDGRLYDAWIKENFIMQIFAYESWRLFSLSSPNMGDLVHFYTRYKFLLQAKDERLYREMGRVVANGDQKPLEEILLQFGELFLRAIAKKNKISTTYNVLEHCAGFLKNHLTPTQKEELRSAMQEFREGIVPLVLPVRLLHLYAKQYGIGYLQDQIFFEPYPRDFALRSDLKAYK